MSTLSRTDVPELSWAEWFPQFARDYRVSGETADHVTIIGPTGTGKTTLAMAIANLRTYVVALGTKPRDPQFSRLLREYGFRRQSDSGLPSPRFRPRVAVWPKHSRSASADYRRHAETFGDVFESVYAAGGWHLVCEEGSHLIDLGLNRVVRRHLRAGRSMSSGLILCSQRPRYIPMEAVSGAQHLIIFGTNDDEDLKRLGGMNGLPSKLVRESVATLGRSYRFLHVNTRDGTLSISKYVPPSNREVPRP